MRFAEEFAAGRGTYVRDQHVVAAVVGESRVVPAADGSSDSRPIVEVVRTTTGGGAGGVDWGFPEPACGGAVECGRLAQRESGRRAGRSRRLGRQRAL